MIKPLPGMAHSLACPGARDQNPGRRLDAVTAAGCERRPARRRSLVEQAIALACAPLGASCCDIEVEFRRGATSRPRPSSVRERRGAGPSSAPC